MTLTSFTFLLFFPIVFLLHYILFSKNRNMQNGFILAASMVFYGWWDWRLLGFLLLTAISTYLAGLWMGKTEEDIKRKLISATAIVLNLGILFVFKYYNFFVQSFIDAMGLAGIQPTFPCQYITMLYWMAEYYDFSHEELFLEHPEWFNDGAHLNTMGAEVYTKMVVGKVGTERGL